MKKIRFCFLIFLAPFFAQAQRQVPDSLHLKYLYFNALQGNVKSILDTVDKLPSEKLNTDDRAFKEKYIARFRSKAESFDYRTKDTLLISIMNIYIRYWNSVLLQQQSIALADRDLAEHITAYIWNCYYKNKQVNRDSVLNDFTGYSEKLLKQHGFGVTNGKTANYYDLLVWAKESNVHYNVQLPETETDVSVVFMDDVVTMGWEEYATFGLFFPGGWATNNALYCVKSTYDLESENFKISYLKHEGQHFADYKLFPELSSADLEYRAKLVEFCYAEEFVKLVSFFLRNSSRDRQNSHAFANNCVLRDLSKLLFQKELESDPGQWKKIAAADVHAAALKLLKQNTAELKKQGKTVKEFID